MASTLLLSIELIYLIEWILEHEKPQLKLFIQHIVKNGFGTKLQNNNSEAIKTNEELHNEITELIEYLEDSIHESLESNKKVKLTDIQEDLAHSLKKINFTNIDINTIWVSLKQAENEISKNLKTRTSKTKNYHKPKEILLKKILQNWHPSKKEFIN